MRESDAGREASASRGHPRERYGQGSLCSSLLAKLLELSRYGRSDFCFRHLATASVLLN